MIVSEIVEVTDLSSKSVSGALFHLHRKESVAHDKASGKWSVTVGAGTQEQHKEEGMSDEEFRQALRMFLIEAERRLMAYESLKRKLKVLGGGK